MISSAKSNMYEVNAASTLAVYCDFVQGTGREVALAISLRTLSPAARNALVKSLAALGYGREACAWVSLSSESDEENVTEPQLGAYDLMSIVEGLDPLAIVTADERSCALLGHAYRHDPPSDSSTRIMGRPCVCFRDLEAMLKSEDGKQRAWALLKKLPRFR